MYKKEYWVYQENDQFYLANQDYSTFEKFNTRKKMGEWIRDNCKNQLVILHTGRPDNFIG